MSETEDVLARIDEVLGIGEDMSIERDVTVSSDAMRSRPARTVDERLAEALTPGRHRPPDPFTFDHVYRRDSL